MFGSNKDTFNRKEFYREVYHIVKEIPAGRVMTYGQIARLAGFPQYSRLVGHALAQSCPSFCLPCHRVVNSEGRTAPHWPEQQALLEQEGIAFKQQGRLNLQKYLWDILGDSSFLFPEDKML